MHVFGFTALVVFIVLSAIVQASDDLNFFVFPQPSTNNQDYAHNLVFDISSTIVFKWETDYTRISFALFQDGTLEKIMFIHNVTMDDFYAWEVPPSFHDNLSGTESNCQYIMAAWNPS